MVTKESIIDRLEYEYALSVYDYGSHVRLTNGSAAYFIDISVMKDKIELHGERYGERIDKSCALDTDELITTLQSTV